MVDEAGDVLSRSVVVLGARVRSVVMSRKAGAEWSGEEGREEWLCTWRGK